MENKDNLIHDYAHELSGRCHKCNIRFIWDRRGRDGRPKRLKDARCPRCRGPLHPTTHLFKAGPTVREVPRHIADGGR
jgi:hypothetical protein